MPGRPSARSTRTSTASGTRSARQSSHAVEIPDDGPVTALRTQVAQVFADAQKTVIAQRKLVGALRKVHEACIFEQESNSKRAKKAKAALQGDFDEDDFNNEVCRCVIRILSIKKSEPVGDKLIRFLCLYIRLADAEDRKYIAGDEPADEVFTPTNRLESRALQTALGFLDARDKTVRFRAVQLIFNLVKHNPMIDQDTYDLIRIAMGKRIRDKEPSVRIQACMCLLLFLGDDDEEDEEDGEDSDDEVAGGIMDKLLNIMYHDPSAEVRRAVLGNMPYDPSNLMSLLERGRDTDPAARRIVYTKILPSLGDFRFMNLVTRDKILRWGLRDRDDGVRKAAAKLFRENWLENCVSSRDQRTDEEKEAGVAPPNMEALSELLERIDVNNSGEEEGMAHEAMRGFWEGRPDYREAVDFDHDFWNNLDVEGAFIARTFNDYCRSAENSSAVDMIEDKMPEVTMFAFILRKHLNTLLTLANEAGELDEDDERHNEISEQFEEQDFKVQQLLHIAMTLDYTDEVGRRQMYNIMRESIAQASLPEECTKLAIEVLRQMCGSRGESEFSALIVEAIADVRDSLLDNSDDGDPEAMDEEEESFHSARSDIDRPMPATSKGQAKELSPEEEEERARREIAVHAKCLHIARCTLENVHGDIEPNDKLMSLVDNLIIPAVQSHDNPIRERGVICLGLATLLSKKLAMGNLDLFFHVFTKGHDNLKEIAVQTLADVMITHPQLLAPLPADPEATTEDAEPKPSPLVRPMTKVLLKGFKSDNKKLSLITCVAASKMLLLGILPPASTAEIIKAFVLTYFDPEAAVNPTLKQALSYFLPVFCHSKLKNAMLMAQIVVPIMSKLLIMRDETGDEEVDDMVGWPIITAHLSDWTDGRKVVGATELGLDGKISTSAEAEEPHVNLSIEILERALTNTCSKDERKPLLSLLSKLSIAPSSTTKKGEEPNLENLSTLHALVTEAVEGKLGVDATQRNYLAKLELSLTKRLGEVEHVTQIQDQEDEADETVVPPASEEPDAGSVDQSQADVTALPDRTRGQGTADTSEVGDVDGSEIADEDDDDTMLAGIQAEGTRMPLEEDTEDATEDDESELPPRKRSRPAVTEDDIMESLLASEM